MSPPTDPTPLYFMLKNYINVKPIFLPILRLRGVSNGKCRKKWLLRARHSNQRCGCKMQKTLWSRTPEPLHPGQQTSGWAVSKNTVCFSCCVGSLYSSDRDEIPLNFIFPLAVVLCSWVLPILYTTAGMLNRPEAAAAGSVVCC